MSREINYKMAGAKLRRLMQTTPNLTFAGYPKHLVESVNATFTCSEDGMTITVEMRGFNVTAIATARPVWLGADWQMEYVFKVPFGQDMVEVFRVYINDGHKASDIREELWGAASGLDFVEYVCECVSAGTLTSPIFSKT